MFCRITWRGTMAAFAVVLSACGGGGGGGSDGSGTPATTKPLSINGTFPVSANAYLDPHSGITLSFDAELSAGAADSIRLSEGANNVPVTVDGSGTSIRVKSLAVLKLRTDYVLTVRAGLKATNGAVLQADYQLPFRTAPALFEAKTLFPTDPTAGSDFRPLIATGDVNGDGRVDIVAVNSLPQPSPAVVPRRYGYRLNVYSQGATGAFDRIQAIDRPSSVAMQYPAVFMFDLDGDSKPEIVVPEYAVGEAPTGLRVFKLDATGKYIESAFVSSWYLRSVYAVDVDGDGRTDLVGIGENSNTTANTGIGFQVFLNTGGQLVAQPPVPGNVGAVEWVGAMDVNHNGRRQLLFTKASGGDGTGPLATRILAYSATPSAPGVMSLDQAATSVFADACPGVMVCRSVKVMDINADGWADLLASSTQAEPGTAVAFMRQPGGGFVQGSRFDFGIGELTLTVADIDRDGTDDALVVSNDFVGAYVAAVFNKRSTALEFSSVFSIPASDTPGPSAISVVDLNGDGYPDLVFADQSRGVGAMIQLRD